LQWLVNSYRQISLPALCEAVSLNEGDSAIDVESAIEEETILLHCSCLVRRNASHDYLELAHFTVQEFLTHIEPNSRFSAYSQRKEEIQPILTRTCLTYLVMDAFQHDVVEDLAKWDGQLDHFPFRAHAVLFWVEYAKYSWEDDGILALARQLFHPSKTLCFLSWARDYFFLSSWQYANDAEDNMRLAFDKVTDLIFDGSVTPIHLVAAIGSTRLCRWLIDSGCGVNHPSSLGTPLHCSLVGIFSLSDALVDEDWLETPHEFMWEGRTKVLEMLIDNGADLTAIYRDPRGKELSCAKLALHASLGRGARHPLITLVVAGAKLDKGLLTTFEYLIDETDYDLEGHEEFVGILIEKLEESTQDDSIVGDVLTAALRFKSSAALVRIRGEIERTSNSLNVTEEELREIFLRAIRFDQTEVMEHLLQDGRLDISSKCDTDGATPLHVAAEWEAANATKMLLSRGANVHTTTEEGFTPLHMALDRDSRNEDCIRALLDAGASIAAVQATTVRTAWHIAAARDNALGLKILAEKDEQKLVSLTTREEEGFTPLFYAAKHECPASFEFLLSQTPEPSNLCPHGWGLVHYAVKMNSIKLLRLLKARGIPLDQKGKAAETALHSIPRQVDPDIVRFLLENGVKPTSVGEDGDSPLHRLIALEISIDRQVFELLATEESIPLVTKSGHTALHFAVGVTEISERFMDYQTRKLYIKWLIDKGANLNFRDGDGKSCINLLAERHARNAKIEQADAETRSGFIELCMSVIEGTTDVELLNEPFRFLDSSFRPLCLAIEFSESLAEVLLARGVDVDFQSHGPPSLGAKDWSAIHFACHYGSNAKLFEKILKLSNRLKEHDSRGYYLPHLACDKGSGSKVYHLKQLCDAGVDAGLHSASPEAVTALMLASAAGKLEHVEYLLDCGMDFHARDSFGWEAVQHATDVDRTDVLALFTGQDVDWTHSIDIIVDEDRLTKCNVFHMAMLADDAQTARWLLESSLVGDLECLNGDGMSALHLASTYGCVALIEVLIAAGANIEAVSWTGLRAIHYAVLARREDIVRILLSLGCILVADPRGLTPELLALKEDLPRIVHLLRERASRIGKIDISFFRRFKNGCS
jgi:ankyrin repeat protein